MLFFLVFSSLSHTPLSAEMSVGTTLLKGTSIAICGVAGTILTSHYIFKLGNTIEQKHPKTGKALKAYSALRIIYIALAFRQFWGMSKYIDEYSFMVDAIFPFMTGLVETESTLITYAIPPL